MIFIPIIKVVSVNCNLKCDYCFYHDEKQTNQQLMNTEILENLINEVCRNSQKEAQFIWHGGEPLLAGIDFFEMVVALQRKHKKGGQKIINKLQSNGTLINERWARFFTSNKFGIGISIDGPQDLHDIFRKFPDGTASFDITWQGIQTLKQNGINPGIIVVVNSQNVKFPEKLFDFFIESNLKKLAFNHAWGKDYSTGKLQKSSVNSIDYSKFIQEIFDLWIKKDDPEIEIRQIRNVLQALLGGKYRSCEFSLGCNRYFTVEYNGNIYPCDYSNSDKSFCFGNIKEGIEHIFSSIEYTNYRNKIQNIRENCLKCEWYKMCKGGCTRDYYLDILDNSGNYFCEGLKEIYQYIHNQLKYYNVLIEEQIT